MLKIERIPGDRNGRLTLIEEVVRDSNDPVPFHRNHRRFRFKCDCGNEVIASWKPLSCGCLQRESAVYVGKLKRKAPGEAAFNHLYASYVNRSTNDSIEFRLSRDEFKELTQQPCFYCGAPPAAVWKQNGRKHWSGYVHNGIDRADNQQGYTIENSAACCSQCNYAKHIMAQQEFFDWIKRVHAHLTAKGVLGTH